MILLKSFYRKKTTKIYLIIFSLIFTIIFFLVTERSIYIKEGNNNYINSDLKLTAKKEDLPKIKNVKNIKDLTIALIITIPEWNNNMFNEDKLYVLIDEDLKDNEIRLHESYSYKNENKDNKLKIKFPNTTEELIIKGYYHSKYDINFAYISKNKYNNIIKDYDSYLYILKLKDWFKKDKTIEELMNSNLNFTPDLLNQYFDDISEYNYIEVKTVSKSNIDNYEFYVSIFTILSIVMSIIFLIVLIITFKNIIIDESKNNKLYHYIGYNKKQTKIISFLKIISLLILSLLISIILNILIYFIL